MASLREQPRIETGQAAAYLPGADKIIMPAINRFRDADHYFSTLFHETIHWSGSPSRLNRPLVAHSVDKRSYGREELIAEMGSAFLCAKHKIDAATLDDSASYIDGWLHALREDKKLVASAAREGRAAVEWLEGS